MGRISSFRLPAWTSNQRFTIDSLIDWPSGHQRTEKRHQMSDADIAVVGLAVMGRNLAFNMAEKGFRVALYNRSSERTDEAMALAGPLADRLVPCHTPEELVAAVKKPRAILLMVQAGAAVDETAARLQP